MIYFCLFALIFLLAVVYDYPLLCVYRGLERTMYRDKTLYMVLCTLFILLSGLSYRVGSDIGRYMYDFSSLQWSDFSLNNLSLSQRQPFWILSQLVCKSCFDNFHFFKFVESTFVNIVIFWFIKKNTKYKYSAVLLYFCTMSFDVNFNILRQAFSICIFLIACYCMNMKRVFLSILLIFSAIMFHNSAFVLAVIPLTLLIDIRKHLKLCVIIVWVLLILVLLLPSAYLLLLMLLGSSDETLVALSSEYLAGDYGNSNFSFIKVILSLTYFSVIAFLYKKAGASNMGLVLFFCYVACYIISYSIPIIGRIKFYFTIPYIIAFCESVYYIVSTKIIISGRKIFVTCILLAQLLNASKHYFIYNPRLGDYNYVQYYPYSSVINPHLVEQRERLVEY